MIKVDNHNTPEEDNNHDVDSIWYKNTNRMDAIQVKSVENKPFRIWKCVANTQQSSLSKQSFGNIGQDRPGQKVGTSRAPGPVKGRYAGPCPGQNSTGSP